MIQVLRILRANAEVAHQADANHRNPWWFIYWVEIKTSYHWDHPCPRDWNLQPDFPASVHSAYDSALYCTCTGPEGHLVHRSSLGRGKSLRSPPTVGTSRRPAGRPAASCPSPYWGTCVGGNVGVVFLLTSCPSVGQGRNWPYWEKELT